MGNETKAVSSKRSPLAQSRIDYIVFGNPRDVKRLVYDYGYEPPKSLPDLSEAVRQLIRQRGKKVVVDLVKLHPDREAFLAAFQETTVKPDDKITEGQETKEQKVKPEKEVKPEAKPGEQKNLDKNESVCTSCGKPGKVEDSYCGCSHSYDEPSEGLKVDITELDLDALMLRYEKISKQSSANPGDKEVAAEATRIWNEIRLRNEKKKTKQSIFSLTRREALVMISLAIVAGILVGLGFKESRGIRTSMT